ncbi:MAG TPA: Na+/H+ antiporter subunit E [Planctomycetota bacterium]|nr:Na+/H+ antiporter subunit E [Planctomycetota bacterium]
MSRLVQFLLCFAAWVLLAWPFQAGPDGWRPAPGALQELVAGALAAGLAAALFGGPFPRSTGGRRNPLRYLWFGIYLPALAAACAAGALDAAYRLLHLRLPVAPGIVRVRTSLRSETARSILAHTISLIPGTLVVDAVGPDLYIHSASAGSDGEAGRPEDALGGFEWLLKRIFE